jgi:3-hydroxyisobutyrate dehydrogenase-like beta-hydroxyacid dehydrogenase
MRRRYGPVDKIVNNLVYYRWMNAQPHIAVLGLGEAGAAFATGLAAAGAVVVGYDPQPEAAPGVVRAESAAHAVRRADLVLSLNAASVAERVASGALPAMRPGAVFADLNTSAADLKRRLAGLAEQHGQAFADVALLAPVPSHGCATPSLVAGSGAQRYAELIRPLRGAVEVVDGPAGAAAARKLLRSVVMKGLAASIVEALAGARAAGCEDWLRENLAEQFGAALVQRLESGSHQHAVRRVEEMAAAADQMRELSVPPRIAEAARDWLRDLAGDR